MSKIRLYNTLTKKVEDFQPLNDKEVKIYTCGPTVYDYPHIGNWYSFLRWDLLVRVLQASDYKTKWVMNITDVGHLVSDADDGEDKLEKGAKREGKSAWAIANFYTDYFIKGLERLNFILPDVLPRATENIDEQIDVIKGLERKGFTYVIDDGVYFDTSKSKDYGKLANLDIKSLKAGARVKLNPQKRNPTDFALWKFSPNPPASGKKRDMEWESPWGKGFPGWAIECSAMAMKYLGESIDIHCGGIDHIPVHHTNEIAQSESLTGKPFAKYWLHSNFIQVDGQKMSKSLGNLITLEDIKNKGYSLAAFRLLALESHYRSEAKFTWENLAGAQNRLNSYQAMAQLRFQLKNTAINYPDESAANLLEVLQDDLNSPLALSLLSKLADEVLKNGVAKKNETVFATFLETTDKLLGLTLMNETDITHRQKALITERDQARQNNDWPASDKIRATLKEQGIELRDTPSGTIWNRL
jgi:cysteinyl-tRNA synthetase